MIAFALSFPPCTFERLSFLHVICFQGRLHAAAVLFSAPTLLYPHIDWGFNFWDSFSGTRDQGSTMRLFLPL
jgi:hypothetical protein